MKAIFAIFLLLSITYLAIFLAYKPKFKYNFFNLANFFICIILPTISICIIGFSIIYIYNLYNDFVYGSMFFGMIIYLVLSISLLIQEIYLGAIFFIVLSIFSGIILFQENVIEIEKKSISETIALYDKSVIDDDFYCVSINISSEYNNQKGYHALMQYSINDTQTFKIPSELYHPKIKLSEVNKLVITGEQIVKCNLLYYCGLVNFTPETILVNEATEYTVYLTEDNIAYE